MWSLHILPFQTENMQVRLHQGSQLAIGVHVLTLQWTGNPTSHSSPTMTLEESGLC